MSEGIRIKALDRATALVALAEAQKARTRASVGPVDHGREASARAQRQRLQRGGRLLARKSQWNQRGGTFETVAVFPVEYLCPLCGDDLLHEAVQASTWACGECGAVVFAHELELCSQGGKGDE